MQKKSSQGLIQTGVARPAAEVLLAPARALSSHMRRVYGEKYQSRYRYAALVFLFDAFLAGVACCLLAVNIFFWTIGMPHETGLEAMVYAPVVVSSQTIPVEVVVKATDGRMHRNVILTWEFAPSTQIEAMSPSAGLLGSVQLGDIAPFGEAHAKARIRVHAEVGASVPLRFRLSEGMWGKVVQGGDVRRVESGVLRAEPVDTMAAVYPKAVIPIRIQNTGIEDSSPLTFRLIRASGAEASFENADTVFHLEKIAAGSNVDIGIQLGPQLADSIQLVWQLEQSGRIVYRKSEKWARARGSIPNVTWQKTAGGYELTGDSEQDIFLFGVQDQIELHKNQTQQLSATRIPPSGALFASLKDGDKKAWLPSIQFPVTTPIPFEVEARYFSTTGDQLGVGPHPPRVGDVTSYWIFWRLGPAPSATKEMRIQAKLAPGVVRTGGFSASIGSQAASGAEIIDWRIPQLERGQIADFGMEIQTEPTSDQVGKVLPLLSTSTVLGFSQKIEAAPLTSLLITDKKANSDGIVRSQE